MTLPPKVAQVEGSKVSLQTFQGADDPGLPLVFCTVHPLWIVPLGENLSEIPFWPLCKPGLDEKIPSFTSQAQRE